MGRAVDQPAVLKGLPRNPLMSPGRFFASSSPDQGLRVSHSLIPPLWVHARIINSKPFPGDQDGGLRRFEGRSFALFATLVITCSHGLYLSSAAQADWRAELVPLTGRPEALTAQIGCFFFPIFLSIVVAQSPPAGMGKSCVPEGRIPK